MIFNCVIDTNIIISALLKSDSNPGKIIEFVKNHTIIPFYNGDILKEYNKVIKYKKFSFEQNTSLYLLTLFAKKGFTINHCVHSQYKFNDDYDEIFYNTYLTLKRKKLNCFLITGNKKHFPNEHNIVSPKEMIEIINLSKENEQNE